MQKCFKLWLIITSIVFFVAILTLLGVIFVYGKIYQDKIYPGMQIGQIDLGNKTKKEALYLIKEKIAEINQEGLVFRVSTKQGDKETVIMPILISATDPDIIQEILVFDPEKTVEEAFLIGREGNFWQKILTQWDALYSPLKKGARGLSNRIYLSYSLDEKELQEILQKNFQELEKPAQDARLVFTKNKFEVEFEKYGYAFDYQIAIKKLKENLDILVSEPIDLTLITDEPKIKKSQTGPALKQAQDILALTSLTLKDKDKEWKVGRNELGEWLTFSFVIPGGVIESHGFQQGDNLPTNRSWSSDQDSTIDITFNQEKVTEFLETIAQEINIPAKEAKFQMKDGRIIEFQISQEGLEMDIEESIEKITKELKNKETKELPLIIELIVKTTTPKITTEEVNTFGIKELIGRGESNFKGSPKNRRHNIKIGADHLNGLLIKPDEEFSLVKTLGSIGPEAGYLPELVIKGNKTIPEYGGGLCQISTTTFRVALDTGLPILERRPHSYRVSYYEPAGMDAAIYNPRPDLRFLNDTGNWILFQTKISGDNLIFEFYGTNDGREVEISQPKIFNIVKPGPTKIIETENLKPGEKKCTERAHYGADAEFTRIITSSDGKIKNEVWKSFYQPWRAVCLIGVEPEPVETEGSQTVPVE